MLLHHLHGNVTEGYNYSHITVSHWLLQHRKIIWDSGAALINLIETWQHITNYASGVFDSVYDGVYIDFNIQHVATLAFAALSLAWFTVSWTSKPILKASSSLLKFCSRSRSVCKTMRIMVVFLVLFTSMQSVQATDTSNIDFQYHVSKANSMPTYSEDSLSSATSSSCNTDVSPDELSDTSADSEKSLDMHSAVPNVPDPEHLSNELRILAMNTDGTVDWTGLWKQTKLRDVHALCLVDTEKPRNHGQTNHLLKTNFSHDTATSICPGLQALFGSTLGGTVNAIGKGWNQRCAGFAGDRFDWGRYSVLKIKGKARQSIWLLSLYSPYNNKDAPGSYYNLILNEMRDYEQHTGTRLSRDSNGDLCPYCQLRNDLSETIQEARQAGAEVVLCGDFNEKWHERGEFRTWAETNNLRNVLSPDSLTGGDTTCFPTKGDPSDIDWVLSTPALFDAGLIKAGVLHEFPIASAHCPIFISIKALDWLQLQNADVSRYKQHKYAQNYILGKSDSKRIQVYQKLLIKHWTKFKVPALKESAEIAVSRLQAAIAAGTTGSGLEYKQRDACIALQLAYNAVNVAFKKSINKMAYRYSTGKNRKTYFSQEMVEIRRMRDRGKKLRAMWKRRLLQQNPFASDSPRGKNRGNRRAARGTNPTINELKHRLVRWFARSSEANAKSKLVYAKVAEELLTLTASRCPNRMTKSISQWQKVFHAADEIIEYLSLELSATCRKNMVYSQHDCECRSIKKCRNLKQIIRNLSIPKDKGGAISKIEVDGELITDRNEVCSRLVKFYATWFGAGRLNRWNCDDTGNSTHPLCDRDQRSIDLCNALLHGKYYEIADEHEDLPPAVKKLYDHGLFSLKIITKGPRKGQKITCEDMESLRTPPTATEWEAAKKNLAKCTHPGKDGITKPSLFHCPHHMYMDVGHLVFLAEQHGFAFDQHKIAQMWLIPKDEGVTKLDRLRALWFLPEILKIYEFIMEGRTDALCRKFGLLETEQSGFEKGKDCGSSIFPIAQLIEDCRISKRELWLAFLDQAKAFDTLESFQGKLMASMVLGIPFEYASKMVMFDESVIAEIITAFGTTSEELGFEAGTFTPQCGGLQGGPRSPGLWKRFYDLLIKAQKLVNAGKLAYITSEDGTKITLTAEVYADDTTLVSGDRVNLNARKETQQDFINYSGSNVKPPKCILAAILFDANGELREITQDENISFTSINDHTTEFCKIAAPTDPIRMLGWYTCLSIEVDQSFIEMMSVCEKECNHIYRQKATGKELTTFVNVKSLPRVLWRMRYSTTGEDAISRLQIMYNKLLRTKAKLIGGFPSKLLYAKESCFGLGFVNFWDAISIDRIITYLKHSYTSGREEEIFTAAVKRSEIQQESSTPVLECKTARPWDGTMLGRVKEFLATSDFSISGGKQNCGHRTHDVSILDLPISPRDAKMIYSGCKISGIFWKSQAVSDDGNTWVPSLQKKGIYNTTSTKYYWYNYRTDPVTGERKLVRHPSKWTLWTEKIKRLLTKDHESSLMLGKYYSDALPQLQPLDVIVTSDNIAPKIVVSHTGDTVQYIPTGRSTLVGASLSNSDASDLQGYKWNLPSLGLADGSLMVTGLFATTTARIRTLVRNTAIKVSAQILPIKLGPNEFRHATIEDALNATSTSGVLGAIFLRYAIFTEAPIASIFTINLVSHLPRFQWVESERQYAPLSKFIGEGNTGSLKKPMREQFQNWKIEAAKFKKGGIIAGGDGSAKELPNGQEAAFAWCVLAIGPLSMSHLNRQKASYIKLLASGGSADWVMAVYRTNTRAEKLHILAAMIALLPCGLNVWYAVDYEGAISTAIDVSTWLATDWINCEDRDVMRALLWMQNQWESCRLTFKIFKMRAHPERWCSLPPSQYTALQQIAVVTDLCAKAVFSRCEGTGVRPYLPGQFRFGLQYKGQDVVGPLRKFLKNIIGNGYMHDYLTDKKHNSNRHLADKLTEWQPIKRWAGRCWTGFSAISNAKYLFSRWATLAFQIKTGIIKDDEETDASLCHCGEKENMWHIIGSGTCSGFPILRSKYCEQRLQMMTDMHLSEEAIRSITNNTAVRADGTYPDWNSNSYTWYSPDSLTTRWLKSGEGIVSRWFQRGPLPCGYIQNSRGVLGLSTKDARKFGEAWFQSFRSEVDEAWARRNAMRHDPDQVQFALLCDLRSKVKDLVLLRRKQGLHTYKNRFYRRLQRSGLKSILEKYEADERAEQASQPLIMNALQQQGLSEERANAFVANAAERAAISRAAVSAIRRRAKNRRKEEERMNSSSRYMNTAFDIQADSAEDEETEEIDIINDNRSSSELVQQFIQTNILDESIDYDAQVVISSMVDNILHQNYRQEWEL